MKDVGQEGLRSQHPQQEDLDTRIWRMFRCLSKEEKRQFLIFFESVPEMRSWPASDHRPHEKEAL